MLEDNPKMLMSLALQGYKIGMVGGLGFGSCTTRTLRMGVVGRRFHRENRLALQGYKIGMVGGPGVHGRLGQCVTPGGLIPGLMHVRDSPDLPLCGDRP